jgi:hypothetical protein
MASGNDDYIKTLVMVFIAFGSFLLAILSGYFAGVGLYFGQAVVEGDVFTGGYKYECTNASLAASECDKFNTNVTTGSYDDYVAFTGTINPLVLRFLQATTIVFALLGLVFLFKALKSSGLWKEKKESMDRF